VPPPTFKTLSVSPLRGGFFFLCPTSLLAFSLREGLFLAPRAGSCPSGWVSSPALRPACACDPTAQPAVWARGADLTAPPPFAMSLPRRPSRGREDCPMGWLGALRVGESNLRPPGGAAIPPEAAGSERASPGGVLLARSHANSEGAPPRDAPARSQPKELRAAARGDAQGPKAANPGGTKNAVTE
jgi:hypothetical protein